MAQETFGQLWHKVLLYAPGTPVPLAQQFVKNAYNKAVDAHEWSEQCVEREKIIFTEYSTGTAAVTNGSASVALTGSVASTAWANLQIAILDNNGYSPFYDISTVNETTDVVTLATNYLGATDTSATFLVAEYFVEFPEDLELLDNVRDAANNWRLRRQFHQAAYLDRIDANRTTSGSPAFYVAAPPRVASGVSYPRYEFWPRLPSATKLVYRYIKKTPLSASTDYPLVALKSEVILWGALAELAVWPGLPERPNPFFSTDLHKTYVGLFEDGLNESILGDLNRAQQMITYSDDDRGYPVDANFIQEHGLA